MSDVDTICHQVNCLTVASHGLSRQLADKYPWVDIYKTRRPLGNRNLDTPETRDTPGTFRLFMRTGCPTIVCFLSRWDFQPFPVFPVTPLNFPDSRRWIISYWTHKKIVSGFSRWRPRIFQKKITRSPNVHNESSWKNSWRHRFFPDVGVQQRVSGKCSTAESPG